MLEQYDRKKLMIVAGAAIVVAAAIAFFIIDAQTPKIGELEPTETKYASTDEYGIFDIPVERLTEGRIADVSAQSDMTFRDNRSFLEAAFRTRIIYNGTLHYNLALVNFEEEQAIAVSRE